MKIVISVNTKKIIFSLLFFVLTSYLNKLSAISFDQLIDQLSSDETLIPYEIGIASAIIFLALLFFMKWEKKKEKQRISELQKRQVKRQIKNKAK